MGIPVSSYTFFHTLSHTYYEKHNISLIDQFQHTNKRKMTEMTRLTDKVLEPYKS